MNLPRVRSAYYDWIQATADLARVLRDEEPDSGDLRMVLENAVGDVEVSLGRLIVADWRGDWMGGVGEVGLDE